MLAPRLALPLCLAALAACAGRPAPNDRPAAAERAVVPSLALDVGHLTEGTTRWSVIMSRDTLTLDLGVMTVATRFVDHGGLPAVLTVRTFPTPRGPIVDSALVLRHTLAPVWQRSHQPTKTMRLDFAPSGVTGTWAPTDSAERTVSHPTAVPVFDATDLEAVIASLPYTEGYSATLPFYTFELGGLETDTVRVVGVEHAAAPGGEARAAWKVAVADPFVTATFWVDRETRRVLRRETMPRRAPGVVLLAVPLA